MTRDDIVRLIASVPVEAWSDRFAPDSPREDVRVLLSPACFDGVRGECEPLPGYAGRVGIGGVEVRASDDLPDGVCAMAGTGKHWARG